jgi:hypothetical protein
MQSMNITHKILILLFGVAISVQAVPPVLNYAGQVAVNGEAFDGNGLFKFALVNADGTTTYWSNDGTSVDGSEPQASVAVAVNGGLYSILLATPPSRAWERLILPCLPSTMMPSCGYGLAIG